MPVLVVRIVQVEVRLVQEAAVRVLGTIASSAWEIVVLLRPKPKHVSSNILTLQQHSHRGPQ